MKLTKQQKITLLGTRIYDILFRTEGFIETDKYQKAEDMFWKVMCDRASEEEWEIFFLSNKLGKYKS